MNIGPNNPSGGSGGGKGRRRRGRRGGHAGRPGSGGHSGASGHSSSSHQGHGGGGHRSGHYRGGGQKETHTVYTRPMDHSYRNGGGNQKGGRGGSPGLYMHPDPEPIRKAVDENAAPRIFAFIDDLF